MKLNWGEAVAKIIKIQRTTNPIWKLQTLLAAVQAIHDSFNQVEMQVRVFKSLLSSCFLSSFHFYIVYWNLFRHALFPPFSSSSSFSLKMPTFYFETVPVHAQGSHVLGADDFLPIFIYIIKETVHWRADHSVSQ